MKTFILLGLACASLAACNIAGLDGTDDAAAQKLESEDNQALSLLNSGGHSGWTLVKANADQTGYSVFKAADGTFHAINVGNLTSGETLDQLTAANTNYQNLQYSLYSYQAWTLISQTTTTGTSCPGGTDVECSPYTNTAGETVYNITSSTYGYEPATEDRYTDPSSGLVFDIGNSQAKDLEAVAATLNKVQTNQIQQSLIASYGLSEDRAQQLATLASSWQNISKTRAMTPKDLAEFQVKALGTDMNTLVAAAKKSANGDSADYNTLLQKAAQLNDISPEQARSIMNGFM